MIATVGQNNAEINWEYAVIERLDEHDLSTRLISFRLVNAIDNRASADNQLLRAGDVVTIFSRAGSRSADRKARLPSSAWEERSMRPGCTA